MLYRLELENFFSVKERQVIDLRVADNAPDLGDRLGEICPGAKSRAPRVVAFFGPNASGKSTVLKALSLIRWFVAESFQSPPLGSVPCERFNDAESANLPIRLAVEFGAPSEFGADPDATSTQFATWRYEMVLREREERKVVVGESLRRRMLTDKKWLRVFERSESGTKVSSVFQFQGYGKDAIFDRVRDNTSVIATLAQFDHKPSLQLIEAARSIYANIFIQRINVGERAVAEYFVNNPRAMELLKTDIQRIDLGILDVDIKVFADGPKFVFTHAGLDKPMMWHLESHGTQRFIEYYPLIVAALDNGGIAVLDEIDIAIHPLILPEIIRWFHDPERNSGGAALWMSCHAVSLLEDLEKEEIYFCEKDMGGRTSVFGLSDIKSVRRTDNRFRKYLSGVYGAVPQIG